MIEPFANNHQSMQIGELVIENQTDKIIIYGDIDLQLNMLGHEQAQQLHELTSKILQAFDKNPDYSKNVPESKGKSDLPDESIDNPFL
ncbi:hypothetical protein ES754_11235 [Psychrobacter frigidicola]|uniref:Uncharacterized protein n=1 Tax=Psychrobacter frigidicola TaxID=45611 RepID=A0A5C7A328_9GAMM|nr:hypothetical protein [Psychrobacter frigidicola]TXD96202.1 hypothetical protein ES754_11235 [Psychrobacter frigidicola]